LPKAIIVYEGKSQDISNKMPFEEISSVNEYKIKIKQAVNEGKYLV